MAFSKAIIKTEYFPPISTFWAATNAAKILLEVSENYQKKSSRNRAKILGVNGVEILSIPLKKGKNNKMPISQVEISYQENWPNKHLHSIRSAYGNAPYFEFYFYEIEKIIKSRHKLLIDLNHSLFEFITKSLNVELDIQKTQSYVKEYNSDVCDLRPIKFNHSYIEGYVSKKYNQVFEEKHGFIEDLSILDLLMCKGPESILYI